MPSERQTMSSEGHVGRTYRVRIERVRDSQGGGFYAEIPALDGCFTQADSLEELADNIRDVVRLWLEQMKADGREAPASDIDPERVDPGISIRPIPISLGTPSPDAPREEYLTAIAV